MTAPEQTETLEQQIARLTAERDALAATAATTATAPAAAGPLKFGDLVKREFHDEYGNPRVGVAFVVDTVEPYEQADGTMSERLFWLAPVPTAGGPITASTLSLIHAS